MKAIATIAACCGLVQLGLIGFGKYVAATEGPSGAPSPQQIATSKKFSVERNIRDRCEKKWGTNYRMIRYCIDKQAEAARSLGY